MSKFIVALTALIALASSASALLVQKKGTYALALSRCNIGDPFAMHGLWPAVSGKDRYGCKGAPKLDLNDADFAAGTALRDDLEKKWFACPGGLTKTKFWKHEWTTHGTCSGWSPVDYFTVSMALMDAYSGLCDASSTALNTAGTAPEDCTIEFKTSADGASFELAKSPLPVTTPGFSAPAKPIAIPGKVTSTTATTTTATTTTTTGTTTPTATTTTAVTTADPTTTTTTPTTVGTTTTAATTGVVATTTTTGGATTTGGVVTTPTTTATTTTTTATTGGATTTAVSGGTTGTAPVVFAELTARTRAMRKLKRAFPVA